MPIEAHDSARLALLVCDECERVRLSDGQLSARSRRDMALHELAPHFHQRASIAPLAIQEGWKAEISNGDERARWSCPDCTQRLSNP